jgi:short-subunit dehydrogenase
LLGRSIDKLNQLRDSILEKSNVRVDFYVCDALEIETIKNCIKEISEELINASLLINISGIFPYGPFSEEDDTVFDECFDVNLRLPYLLSKGLFKILKKDGGGKIINIGSSSSYAGFKNTATYCASKHGLLGLSRALNDEWKAEGVSVHCISPGTIDTEMAGALTQDKDTYITTDEFSELVYDTGKYQGNMIVEEVKVVRKVIK